MKIDRKTCLKIFGCGLLLFIVVHYWDNAIKILSDFINASMPIIIGLAIAYVLNILMSFYERHYFPKHSNSKFVRKSRRAVCLIASLLTLTAIVTLIIWLVIPELTSCIQFFLAQIPHFANELLSNELINDLLPKDILATLSSIDWNAYISDIFEYASEGIGDVMDTVVSAVVSVFSGLLTGLISFIFAIYLLLAKDKLQSQCIRFINCYFHSKRKKYFLHILSVLNSSFHRFIVGQCIEAVILGVLCIIGMLIFDFPYAVMIGTLIGFTALVPIAGAFIGAGIGAIMIYAISPVKALLFILFIIILQQLEENLIYPKVVGKSVGLPSLWVLAAITVGGGVMGIMGMLIGVPLAAAIYQLVREDVEKREKKAAQTLPALPDLEAQKQQKQT